MDAPYPVAPFTSNQGSQISNRNLFVAAWRWTIGANIEQRIPRWRSGCPGEFWRGHCVYAVSDDQFKPRHASHSHLGFSVMIRSSIRSATTKDEIRALGQLSDNFGWTKGRHALTFGVSATSIWYNDFFESSGTLNFGVDNNNDPIANVPPSGTNGQPVFSGFPGSCMDASCADKRHIAKHRRQRLLQRGSALRFSHRTRAELLSQRFLSARRRRDF